MNHAGYTQPAHVGVSAVIAIFYVLALLSAVFSCMVTVTVHLCEIHYPVLLGSTSVLLLQANIPSALYEGYQFSVAGIVADVVGIIVSTVWSILIFNAMRTYCPEDSSAEECINQTSSLSPYTWALVWSISLIVFFGILLVLKAFKIYYLKQYAFEKYVAQTSKSSVRRERVYLNKE